MRHRDGISVLESARLFWPETSARENDLYPCHWADVQTCECSEIVHQRNTLVCKECGTIYGVARFQSFRSGWSRLAWEVDFGVA